MKILFIDGDPVIRGQFHCMASIAGIEHAVVGSLNDALSVLGGFHARSDLPWSFNRGGHPSGIEVVLTGLNLPDCNPDRIGELLRKATDQAMIYAVAFPEDINGGENFDRVFFKPSGAEAAFNAALDILGDTTSRDLVRHMMPHRQYHAA